MATKKFMRKRVTCIIHFIRFFYTSKLFVELSANLDKAGYLATKAAIMREKTLYSMIT